MTTWVEVDTAALTANAREVRGLVAPAELCAVVKANGYGHGAVLAAEAFLAGGASRLAVTTVAEGIELRAAGITAPILLLASHAPDETPSVVQHGLTAAVSDSATVDRLAAATGRVGKSVAVHLLVDTGMGRDGVLPLSAPDLYRRMLARDLSVEGVFTHFPNSIAKDKGPTRQQLARFLAVVAQLEPRPRIVHAANSGAAVDVPEARLDMVRVGTLLYGQYPSEHSTRALSLANTWTLKSRLVELRHLPAGSAIGYGSEHVLKQDRTVGTLLVGWQHGFGLIPESVTTGWRGLRRLVRHHAPTVRVNGVTCPVLGRISMQTCVVDVTAVPEVAVGDEAVIPARRVTTDRGIPRKAVGREGGE